MNKNLAYAVIVALGLAVLLNLLYIIDIMAFFTVQIGCCAVALAFIMHTIVFYKKTDSPIFYKNWKKNQITALFYCVLAFSFIVTLTVAVFSTV